MEQNIDFQKDGKKLPLYILKNFKDFRLLPFGAEQIGEDSKKAKNISNAIIKLKKHQEFLGKFLSYNSPFKNIFVYHELGSGKTLTVINIYNVLLQYTNEWNVFILIKSSLKDDPWIKDLKRLFGDRYEKIMKNVIFISYDSPKADIDFLEAKKASDSTKQNIYIFDEAHNFIRNVYSNKMLKQGKRALTIYDYIIREKKENDSSRVILMSGTPAINEPYEIALLINLLRPDSFPNSEKEFKDEYINTDKISLVETVKEESKNRFMRRILGLVSYYVGSDPSYFPSKSIILKKIFMSDYQRDIYKIFEMAEDKLDKGQTVYKTYTRQSSNFVFPTIGKDISGETRPRPNKFRISEKEAIKIIEGRVNELKSKTDDPESIKELMNNTSLYLESIKIFMEKTKEYFNQLSLQDKNNSWTLENDINEFRTKYKSKFKRFWTESKKKSELLKALYQCSCKYTACMFYILSSKGPIIIFSNFVKMEGLEIIKVYLQHFGYFKFKKDKNLQNYKCYTEFHGDISREERTENIRQFNNIENSHGKIIKIVLISPAGSEGINTKFVRQIHIMDPYWNEPRIKQLMGRGIRYDSHTLLPKDERHVDIFRYQAVIENRSRLSTDESITKLSMSKQKLLNTFLLLLKEAAVDCELFKEHNMNSEKYNCFKFNESTYFSNNPGPFFKQEKYYDKYIDDGTYANNSKNIKAKVYKVKAKIIFNEALTESDFFWYNPKNFVVYDFELKYPIGKVKRENGLPIKDKDNEYIIEQVIDVPKFID